MFAWNQESGFVPLFQSNTLIPAQSFNAAVIGGFPSLRKETARYPLVMIPVVRHTVAAFAVSGAGIGTRTGSGVAAKVHFPFLLLVVFPFILLYFQQKRKEISYFLRELFFRNQAGSPWIFLIKNTEECLNFFPFCYTIVEEKMEDSIFPNYHRKKCWT